MHGHAGRDAEGRAEVFLWQPLLIEPVSGFVNRTEQCIERLIRIDEVSKPGIAKISPLPEGSSKVTPFPTFTRGK